MEYKIDKIKLVHFIHKPFLAGAQRASLDVLRSLTNSNVEMYLLYANDKSVDSNLRNIFIKEFEDIGVKTVPLNKLNAKIGISDIFAIIEVYRVLKRIKPDIINTISSKPFFIGGIVSYVLRIPQRIHTVQGLSWFADMPFFTKYFRYFLEQLAMLFFNKIVFVNNYYTKFFPLQKKKATYIPNGKMFQNLSPTKINSDLVRILFVGRLDFQKDPITLLKSFEYYLKNYSSKKKVVLDIVGDGPDRYNLESFVSHSELLSNNIVFHGWSSSVNQFLNKSDIFISTPRYEAFGFVFLEAANYYLPVISTNVEGVPEVVLNGFGGVLHDQGDYKSISNSINLLVENYTLRSEFGKFHGDYCREKYHSKKIENLYKNLYHLD